MDTDVQDTGCRLAVGTAIIVPPCDQPFPSTSESTATAYYQETIVSSLLTYSPPVLLVLGTIGNLLMAVTLTRMLLSGAVSTALYPLISSLADVAVLYSFCGCEWVNHFMGIDLREIIMKSSGSLCKLYPFVSDLALHMSIWSIVAMAIETTFVQLKPDRAGRINRLDIARAVLLFLIVITVCVNAHCFWTYSLLRVIDASSPTNSASGGQTWQDFCTVSKPGNQQNDNFFKFFWPLTVIIFVDLGPFVIAFVCVFVMAIIRRRAHQQTALRLQAIWRSNNVEPISSCELHSSFLAISISLVLLICPKVVCDIFVFATTSENTVSSSSSSSSLSSSSSSSSSSLESAAHFSSVETSTGAPAVVSRLLMYLFCSSKILWMLLTSPSFRKQLLLTACCRRNPWRRGLSGKRAFTKNAPPGDSASGARGSRDPISFSRCATANATIRTRENEGSVYLNVATSTGSEAQTDK